MWRATGALVAILLGCGQTKDDPKLVEPRPARTPTTESSARWWCFAAPRMPLGRCRATREECGRVREGFLRGRNAQPCRDALTVEQCRDIQREFAERFQHVSECESQEHAWCFQTQRGSDSDFAVCAPTPEMCASARAATLQKPQYGIRVKSDCTID